MNADQPVAEASARAVAALQTDVDAAPASAPPAGDAASWRSWRAAPGWFRAGAVAFVSALIALGLVERVWLVTHRALTSDEAIVGLLARGILHGHFSAFYSGQYYGGVEPYVTAALFAVFGQSATTVNLTPVVLCAVAAVLVWRVGRYVLPPYVAGLVGLLVWTFPIVVLPNSTREGGFRFATLVLGLGGLLIGLQLNTATAAGAHVVGGAHAVRGAHATGGGPRVMRIALFGLVLGLCTWSDLESVYFLLPCLYLAVRALRTDRAQLGRRIGGLALGYVVGAAPMIWDSITVRFAPILHPTSGAFPNSSVFSRAKVVAAYALPISSGARSPFTGRWYLGAVVGIALSLLVGAAVIGGVRGAIVRRRAPTAAVVALAGFLVSYLVIAPLLKPTSFWQDGRYAIFVPFVLPILVFLAAWWLRGGRLRVVVVAGVVAALAAVTVAELPTTLPPASVAHVDSTFSVEQPSLSATVSDLERAGLTTGYAGYWVAYVLDFESGGRLVYSPTPSDTVRLPATLARVNAAPRITWLFCDPTQAAACANDTTAGVVDPPGLDLVSLTAWLRTNHIAFRTIPAGPFTAVVPASAVPWSTVAGGS